MTVLVTGATGKQGGGAVRALRAAGVPVRALVRDPTRARQIEALGAELMTGDLEDPASLTEATRGTRAVFSVQQAPFDGESFDFAAELAQATNLIEAARAAGVEQFIQSTVSGAGQHVDAPGWAEGRWASLGPYYATKAGIQERVRAAGFPFWTILKPGFFMENFLPSMRYLLPRGVEGGIVTVIRPQTRLSLIAAADIGRAVAAAVQDPARTDRLEIELAGDLRSMTEIAASLSRALGVDLRAPDLTLEEAVDAGMPGMGADSHEFIDRAKQPIHPEEAQVLDVPLQLFDRWAQENLPES